MSGFLSLSLSLSLSCSYRHNMISLVFIAQTKGVRTIKCIFGIISINGWLIMPLLLC